MSWIIKIPDSSKNCPYRLKGNLCNNKERKFYNHNVIQTKCEKEKCPIKVKEK
ncbi:MAG: hypothetical protein ACOCRX_07505 [Candidatus Woesearchaeota archaeon]